MGFFFSSSSRCSGTMLLIWFALRDQLLFSYLSLLLLDCSKYLTRDKKYMISLQRVHVMHKISQ